MAPRLEAQTEQAERGPLQREASIDGRLNQSGRESPNSASWGPHPPRFHGVGTGVSRPPRWGQPQLRRFHRDPGSALKVCSQTNPSLSPPLRRKCGHPRRRV